MGYTTDFEGRFILDRPLSLTHRMYLSKFSDTRRMKRDPAIAETFPDPVRLSVGLRTVGEEGGYFVGALGFAGQAHDASIVNYNEPPRGQPGLWCQWVPSEDGFGIEWNGTEKFYRYVEWIEYLIGHFLGPWGYTLNGKVRWQGENEGDRGVLLVEDNVVSTTFPDSLADMLTGTPVNPSAGYSIEPHGEDGKYALYFGRGALSHGLNLCALSDFDFRGEATREMLVEALNALGKKPSLIAQEKKP